jgi:FkbM family methyltransferase
VIKARWPFIKTLVRSRTPNIFQVGANDGTEITAFRSLWPRSHIWCFEPRVDAFKTMKDTYGRAPRVHLINQAVSKTQGIRKLRINKMGGTSSFLEINPKSPHYNKVFKTVAIVEVPTVTLDGFCAQKIIKNIGFLMIDVQGGELDVLRGAEGLLRRRAIGVIYTEVFLIDLYKDCPQFADVRQYLEGFGYRFVKFFNFGKALGKPPTMWSDALFVKGD